jgi:hypothetical protein
MQAYPSVVDIDQPERALEFKDIEEEANLNDLLKIDDDSSASESFEPKDMFESLNLAHMRGEEVDETLLRGLILGQKTWCEDGSAETPSTNAVLKP